MARIKAQCNFCGKGQDQVRRLVAGPGVFICDQCIELCNEVLRESPPSAPASSTARPSWRQVTHQSWFRNLFKAASYTT